MEIAEWDGDCYFHHSCHPGSLHDDRVGADILHLGPLPRLGAHDGHRSGSSPWPVIYFRTPLIYFTSALKCFFKCENFPTDCKLCVKGVSRLWRTTFQHWWCNWLPKPWKDRHKDERLRLDGTSLVRISQLSQKCPRRLLEYCYIFH